VAAALAVAQIEAYPGEIAASVEATPDMTLAEGAAQLKSEHRLVYAGTMRWAAARVALREKNSPT
jgi:hypothetical protein